MRKTFDVRLRTRILGITTKTGRYHPQTPTMPIPDFQTIMLPFMQVLADGKTKSVKEVASSLAIQAKRYTEATIGRPEVQKFVGGMDFVQANKGVMITTSQFSKDAHEFLSKIVGKKVVLIDGAKVASLMREYNIGVVRTKLYEVKEVSNDFFDEDNG